VLAVNIGGPELVILFIVLVTLVLPIVVVVMVLRSAQRRSSNQGPSVAATAPTVDPTGQSGPVGQWAADPFGRHQLRYYDGSAWTQHVMDDGRPSTDLPQ